VQQSCQKVDAVKRPAAGKMIAAPAARGANRPVSVSMIVYVCLCVCMYVCVCVRVCACVCVCAYVI